jgi:eukaryotic-like serine/threonine-protein kinase
LALTPGTRLGPYEVVSAIGAGGMGEVYRATDSKLKRQVAIKILPAPLAADHDRLMRFQREAEVLASLNHPHIAGIYGLEETDGSQALIMELVEGEDLSAVIARGAMSLTDALPIAKQIAEALEAAHEQGIIHRDLKPANIKVRADGTVKVLDFGLAKALDPADMSSASADALANSPTITSPAMTEMGTILGTAAYMSPEQAKGRAVDRRTDIWAFGAVLYEMLTGRRAFDGQGASDTLARILMKEPDWTALPATVPPTVAAVLRRCLQKDRKQRMRDIGDVSLALEGAFDTAAPQTMATATSSMPRGRLAWAVATVLGLLLAGLAFVHVRETPTELRRLHLSVPLSEIATLGSFALSPDGRSLVMSYQTGLGIRSLDSGEIRLLGGLGGGLIGRTPFWSPDGRTLAFFAERKLKTVAASGGPPQTLCENVGLGGGGTWSRAGAIVFATEAGVLSRVSAAGGACTDLSKPEPGVRRAIPVFLPDGEHFLYVVRASEEARRGLYVASLADPIGRRLLPDQSSGLFVPNGPGSKQGHLLFVREQALMAAAFDTASLQLSDEPVKVADHVSFTNTASQIAAFADTNGTLMYLANSRPDRQLVWYDRSGKELARGPMTGQTNGVSLAPDGKRLAFGRADAQGLNSLWLQDRERNQETRLTTPPLSPGAAVLSPDGQHVVFAAAGVAAQAMYIKSVTGGAEDVLLHGGTNGQAPSDWSRYDRWLVYTEIDPKTGGDLWLLADPSKPSADIKPIAWLGTPAIESQGQISPDGRWLAYCSDESGRLQVYLRPFTGAAPAPDTKWPVSASGREPRWRADGKELFYVESVTGTSRLKLMSVPIGRAPNPTGIPKLLFEFQAVLTVPQANVFVYSPSADGQRFLINVPSKEARPSLEVILNWGQTRSGK